MLYTLAAHPACSVQRWVPLRISPALLSMNRVPQDCLPQHPTPDSGPRHKVRLRASPEVGRSSTQHDRTLFSDFSRDFSVYLILNIQGSQGRVQQNPETSGLTGRRTGLGMAVNPRLTSAVYTASGTRTTQDFCLDSFPCISTLPRGVK